MVLVWLIAGICVLFLWLMIARWVATLEPRTLIFTGKVLAAVALALLALWLAFSGRIGWLLGLVPFSLPLLLRRGTWAATAGAGTFSPGGRPRTSNVRTRFLDMRLEHDSGDLDGQILEGPYAGRQLSDLSVQELCEIHWLILASDRKSARLLESYLDRRAPEWRNNRTAAGAQEEDSREDEGRQQQENGPGTANSTKQQAKGASMSRDEAFRILGLAPGASEADVRDAHHRLISSLHPDRGGSSFLAAQVNRARDVLLS